MEKSCHFNQSWGKSCSRNLLEWQLTVDCTKCQFYETLHVHFCLETIFTICLWPLTLQNDIKCFYISQHGDRDVFIIVHVYTLLLLYPSLAFHVWITWVASTFVWWHFYFVTIDIRLPLCLYIYALFYAVCIPQLYSIVKKLVLVNILLASTILYFIVS